MNVYPAIRMGQENGTYVLTMSAREAANRIRTLDDDATLDLVKMPLLVSTLQVAVVGGNPRWTPACDELQTGRAGLLSFNGEETLYCLDSETRLAALRFSTSKANPDRVIACQSDVIISMIVPAQGESEEAFCARLRTLQGEHAWNQTA
jgi:hypothetical protein